MRQQRDLGELHGTRERRPGAVCGSFRKTLLRPWESLSRIVVLGGGGECSVSVVRGQPGERPRFLTPNVILKRDRQRCGSYSMPNVILKRERQR